MLNDLAKVDFNNVHDQATWVCDCDKDFAKDVAERFKIILSQESDLEAWADWLEMVIDKRLEKHIGKPSYPQAARTFLLKWSFYW